MSPWMNFNIQKCKLLLIVGKKLFINFHHVSRNKYFLLLLNFLFHHLKQHIWSIQIRVAWWVSSRVAITWTIVVLFIGAWKQWKNRARKMTNWIKSQNRQRIIFTSWQINNTRVLSKTIIINCLIIIIEILV